MTQRERQQAAALKVAVLDQGKALEDFDARFIGNMARQAESDMNRWLTEPQGKQLRRLLIKYQDELKAAGKGDLVYTNEPKRSLEPIKGKAQP